MLSWSNQASLQVLILLHQEHCYKIKSSKTSRSLRSATMEYLEEQRSCLVTYGDRSFNVAGPKLWNNLPLQIRKSSSIQSFKKELKSHLFKNFVSFGFKWSLMENDILLLILSLIFIFFYCEGPWIFDMSAIQVPSSLLLLVINLDHSWWRH